MFHPFICVMLDYCRTGDTRLVGGRTEREGRVEVCSSISGRWGTVCDKQWTSAHTAVVCRHLGYNGNNGETGIKIE